jgi:2,4-dienoyl-CoA reductase-like NADH-dependent reductase (Old Yellow Enzyme family)/thioredoxin reductase
MHQFIRLFKPLEARGTVLRNRIVLPAMNTNYADPDGSVSEKFTRFYVERGKGGAGLLIVSSAYIDRAAKKRVGSLILDDDVFIPKLKGLTDAVHATGAKIFQQLNHNGRLLSSSKDLKTNFAGGAVGPSPVPHLLTGEVPHVLTKEEIAYMVEKFAQAARRAKEAGFDGVEIHGSHGYLINQFYSVYSNRREDEYGGSLENRMRFPLEVYRRARALTGERFLICYRLNVKDYAPVETPLEDLIALAMRLENEGVDFLHFSAGNSETPAFVLGLTPPGSALPGCNADLTGAVKVHLKVPVIAVGRITTPELAEQILREGKADMVAMGRALIADPYLPQKALRGEPHTIRRCIGCNQGCMDRLTQEKGISCIHNPEVGREGELSMAQRPKKVWVIGGGPSGMEAALVAALRGHRVELFEKRESLGGQCMLAAVPPGKEDFDAVREFLEGELKRREVPVHTKVEVTAEKVAQEKPEVVILATGSIPLVPDLPGIRGGNVTNAREVIEGKPVGQKVVVVGGGLVGVETALFLSAGGKRVVVIEMLDEIGRDAGSLNRARLKEELRKTDIEVRCRTKLLRVDEKSIDVESDNGIETIGAETIVIAVGAKSENPLLPELKRIVSEVYAVGDCASPRDMLAAINEAFDIALRI